MKGLIRVLDVGFVASLCFLFAFFFSRALAKLFGEPDMRKSRGRRLAEVTLQFGIIGVVVYLARSIIKKIPFPLDGYKGYDHHGLAELRSLPLMVFIFMFFQSNLQKKVKNL
jgi:hypothetical protein